MRLNDFTRPKFVIGGLVVFGLECGLPTVEAIAHEQADHDPAEPTASREMVLPMGPMPLIWHTHTTALPDEIASVQDDGTRPDWMPPWMK